MAGEAQLAHVLWLGGMSGVGKTTAARRIARRHDLCLYCFDSHTYAHQARLDPPEVPFADLVVDSSPEELADRFEAGASRRFALMLEDVRALPAAAPLLVDGPQLLPRLVASVVSDPARVLYVTADPALQRELVTARGLGSSARAPDPDSAHAKRLARDEILSTRLTEAAQAAGFTVVRIGAVTETEPAVERAFLPLLADWIAADHGDVAARRRNENAARLRQWRSHAEVVPAAAEARIGLACECDRPGCGELVEVGLAEAEALRAAGEPLLAH